MSLIPLLGQSINISDIQKAFGGKNSNSFQTANSLNIANNYTISGLSLNNGNISNINTITATTLIGNGNAITNLNYNNITNPPNLNIYATITNLNSINRIITGGGVDIGDHVRYTFDIDFLRPAANNSILCRIIFFNIINSTGIIDGGWYHEGVYQYKSDANGYSNMYNLQTIKSGPNGFAIEFYAGYLCNVYNYWLSSLDRSGKLLITNIIKNKHFFIFILLFYFK